MTGVQTCALPIFIGELVQADEDSIVLAVTSKPSAAHTVSIECQTIAETRLVIEI